MFRYILFFTLLSILAGVSESHRNRHKHWKSQHPEKIFDYVSRDVISADRKLNDLCNDNNGTVVNVFYEPTEVKIEVQLHGFEEKHVAVKIKHRVLFIHAETEGRKRDRKVFGDVKILSDVCDTKAATWTFSNGVIEVRIPYKKQTFPCIDVDDDEICVPKTRQPVEEGREEKRTEENEIDVRGTSGHHDLETHSYNKE